MKRIKANSLLCALVSLLLSGLLCCCNDERIKYDEGEDDELKMVTFSVKVPGANAPKTYALTESDENEVSSIAILLFDGSGNYTYQPLYSNAITTDPGDSRVKTFTVQVPEGTYDLVILANARTSLANVLGNIFRGDSKESVLNRLLLKKSDKWNATSGTAGYIPIPMWGEIPNLTINGNMSTNAVSLKRMVSKIDLSLSVTAQSKFNLQSVRLYNYNNQGQIAPYVSNWSPADNKVTAPSVPGTAQKPSVPVTNPHLFDGTAITKALNDPNRGISCTNEIYTFEALAGSSSDMGNNTCLVVGGFYGEDTKLTYYRVDFSRDAATPVTYLSLLRNHWYTINVTNVKEAGHKTPEDAFNARPVNIEATVVEWNETQISEIEVEEQYLLGVSQGEFTFTREERKATSNDNTLFVSTNYPDGWSVAKIVDADGNNVNSATNPTNGWLALSPTTGASGATVETRLLLTENKGLQTRTAFIHLTAGRLSYIVTVRQGIDTKLDIAITDAGKNQIDVLEFISTPQEIAIGTVPVAQSFNLNWSPALSDLFFTSTTRNSSFVFATGAGLDEIPVNGMLTSDAKKKYTVQPPAISPAQLSADPFYERSSIYLYSVSDGVNTVNKTLTLRQVVYNMIPVVESNYLMDGTQKSFSIRCNSPFTVTLKTNPNSVITLRTTSGGSNTSATGTPVYFDIINDLTNPTLFEKDAVVTIKSPTGLFPDTDVTLTCLSGIIQPLSNSYIVAPSSKPILIPVSRANESKLARQLGTSEIFTVNLLWTDKSGGVAANSTVSKLLPVGTGDSGYIYLRPGSAAGNAVVAVNNRSSQILWSWHIWVTDYSPGTATFMDRNLGAIGNTPGQVATKGLLYQWGRKDPFPSTNAVVDGVAQSIYSATGASTSIGVTSTSAVDNFANSVANPTTFYSGTDWHGTTSQDHKLWDPDVKTVYDPCPNGWRVPSYGSWGTGTINISGSSWQDYGLNWTAAFGGFFPAAGAYASDSGALVKSGTSGYYWQAGVTNSFAYSFTFVSDSGNRGNYGNRTNGYSVRCTKE